MPGIDDLLSMAGGLGGAGAAIGGVSSLATGGIPVLPLAIGGAEMIGSIIKQHQAKKLKEKLDTPDPALMGYMNEIDRQRKSFETGSAYGQEMKELKNQESATQMGVIRAARGNTGSALQAIEQVGLNTGIGYGKIAAQGQERQDRYTQMYGDLLQRLEQRKYEENMDDYNQKRIDAKDARIKGLQTILNSASLGSPGQGGLNLGTNKMRQLLQMLYSQQSFAQTPQTSPDQIYDLPDKSLVA